MTIAVAMALPMASSVLKYILIFRAYQQQLMYLDAFYFINGPDPKINTLNHKDAFSLPKSWNKLHLHI